MISLADQLDTTNGGLFIMQRSKSFRRKQRANAIKRKSYIASHVLCWSSFTPGTLSKGKVHCSCVLCRGKTKQNMGVRDRSMRSWKISDVRKIMSMESQLEECS